MPLTPSIKLYTLRIATKTMTVKRVCHICRVGSEEYIITTTATTCTSIRSHEGSGRKSSA